MTTLIKYADVYAVTARKEACCKKLWYLRCMLAPFGAISSTGLEEKPHSLKRYPDFGCLLWKLLTSKYFNKQRNSLAFPTLSGQSFQINSTSNWLLEWNFPSSSFDSLFCRPLPFPTNPHTCHLPGCWAPELVYNPCSLPQLKYDWDFHHDLRFSCYCSPAHGKLECKRKFFKMPDAKLSGQSHEEWKQTI